MALNISRLMNPRATRARMGEISIPMEWAGIIILNGRRIGSVKR